MPYLWVPPEVLLEYQGYTVSYLYEEDLADGKKLQNRFTLSESDDAGAFSLSDLPLVDEAGWDKDSPPLQLVLARIRQAIDSGFFDEWEDDEGNSYRNTIIRE